MDHFSPHHGAQFEGWYSKFDLPSGAKVALIICSVPKAPERPHMVSFTYMPKDSNDYFQREIWADRIDMVKTADDHSFELRVPGIGHMNVSGDGLATYSIKHKDFSFIADTTSCTPWSTSYNTPEGLLVHLPLPLHWHVNSLASTATFDLSIPSFPHLSPEDKSGTAHVHQEKNWAQSFPSAHIWVQARSGPAPSSPSTTSEPSSNPSRSICIAGGQILGTEAYLLGYRSSSHPSATPRKPYELDFRPPLAMRLLPASPTLRIAPDFDNRTFSLSARSWGQRIDVVASAEPGTFFPLSSPFPDGHRENFLAESFRAEIRVRVFEWRWGTGWWTWWAGGEWVLKEEAVFQDGSLEFGGGYYGFAGSKTRRGR